MSKPNISGDVSEAPAWSLQRKRPSPLVAATPSAQSAQLFDSGNFAGWTNVPNVGTKDPYILDQMRPLRRVLTSNPSGHAPEPFAGGKRIVGPHQSEGSYGGKRGFPELVGMRSTEEVAYRGLKRVESRARSDVPALSNPNTAVKESVYKPESVKMFDGFNQVNYRAWVPEGLKNAEHGDWNWNTRLGNRRVSMTKTGEPIRSLEQPVAWPSYKGYPPTLEAGTNTRIDYALKIHGRQGGFTLKSQHPDVLESRANRAAASAPAPVMTGMPSTVKFIRGAY